MGEVNGVIERFFPVILKPVTLVLLFFLTYRFMGNFGFSYITMIPVSELLFPRLSNTLLLIGLSTLFSTLIGVGLSVVLDVLSRSSRRKPSTFAHSLGGFFFGFTPFVALMFLFFFSLHLEIFPVMGMHTLGLRFADPLAYITDVAWHLAMPVTVLVFVNAVRTLLVIWSSGLFFTSKSLLKRLLLPVTTIDFTFIISAVIFVEWVFAIPGIGRLMLQSAWIHDYPVVAGSFVVFVGIAVGLGFVSVLFDFIQRLFGLRDDLDKKVATKSKTNVSQTRVSKNYIKLFLRRKGLVIGSAIVIAFLVLAIFVPGDVEWMGSPMLPPSMEHIFGTDARGRDVLSLVIYGARTMMIRAFPIAFFAVILGLPFGFLSGYFQGWADRVAMSLTDTLSFLPVFPTFLVVVSLFDRPWNMFMFLLTSLLFLPALATKAFRNTFLVRPTNQKFKGDTTAKQVFNVFKDLIANFCLTSISVVLLLLSMDFVGFGDPASFSWGILIEQGLSFLASSWWIALLPIIIIGLFALGLLLVGAGLEDESS